ncbi:hypothetical protein ACIBUR_28905 [Streptomyces anulatus]
MWRELSEYSNYVYGERDLGITAREWKALAGGGCLHLALDSVTLVYLMSALQPALHGPVEDAKLVGVPGLRLAHVSAGRIELRSWDGHGRIVLLPDAEGYKEWMLLEKEESAQYTICSEVCPPSRCTLAGTSGHPLVHLLRHHTGLHRAEQAVLLVGSVDSEDFHASGELRGVLTGLPAPAVTAHELEFARFRAGGVKPVPPLHSRLPSLFPQQLGPDHFQPAHLNDPRTADLADALARQLLQLLADKRAYPGDVLLDPMGIVTRIGGRGPAARWTQLALQYVAHRYGLLRYRPRQPNEPSGPRGAVWAVSEAASTLAPLAFRSLADGTH